MPFQILTFCGSLRAASSNRALLDAVEQLAPEGTTVRHYRGIAGLPHFTPDLDQDNLLPADARDLRQQVAEADGLLFAVPEYMHCLPGSFKNALDWMVGCQRFPGKPVALAHVTARHAFAPAQLEDVLKTMSARIVNEAGFNLDLKTNQLDAAAICADSGYAETIRTALSRFGAAL
ncbi:NADPH-dependent FMN reductase [Roseibium sp.]|uniref:NADPH-dependent FMN reductase n=1 Tax=Roseibium sp. TaxID=1936156 RepID=UPI003D0979D6